MKRLVSVLAIYVMFGASLFSVSASQNDFGTWQESSDGIWTYFLPLPDYLTVEIRFGKADASLEAQYEYSSDNETTTCKEYIEFAVGGKGKCSFHGKVVKMFPVTNDGGKITDHYTEEYRSDQSNGYKPSKKALEVIKDALSELKLGDKAKQKRIQSLISCLGN